MRRIKPLHIAWIVFSVIGYGLVAWTIKRYETTYLLSVYAFLFFGYILILKNAEESNVPFYIGSAFLFRIIFFFSLPTLSDDFYRFIWDGRLWNAGLHPFLKLPQEYLTYGVAGIDQTLFNSLNSKEYFTIYPPISQAVFWLAVKISPGSIEGSVLVMRTVLLIAEAGSILLIIQLLKKFNLSRKQLLIYALNPLVIIELIGNLHFEALMIFFLLATVYSLVCKRWILSGLVSMLAIGTKLIPLIFFPVLFRSLEWKNFLVFAVATVFFLLLCFYPMYNWQVINSMSSSIGLYFNKFEFNASLYYLVREIGFMWYGYNIIQTVGWKLGVLVLVLILIYSFYRKGDNELKQYFGSFMLQDWMFVLMIYFSFTTTLHPWYITTLLAFSVFTKYKFALVWSGLVFLSYSGYTTDSFKENLWITACEYIVVFGFLIYELYAAGNFNRFVKR